MEDDYVRYDLKSQASTSPRVHASHRLGDLPNSFLPTSECPEAQRQPVYETTKTRLSSTPVASDTVTKGK